MRDFADGRTWRTIVADPDWRYANFGAAKHGAARAHYAGSDAGDISSIPVARWARRDTTLLLWATLPKLDEAVDVMRAWGFALVTSVPWVKTTPASAELAKGIGFWFYATAEVLLVCQPAKRSKARAPSYRKAAKPDGLLVGDKGDAVFYARRGAHSLKPLSLLEWIGAYLPGPYLELFSRSARPGWTCWGHETGWHLGPEGVTPYQPEQQHEGDDDEPRSDSTD